MKDIVQMLFEQFLELLVILRPYQWMRAIFTGHREKGSPLRNKPRRTGNALAWALNTARKVCHCRQDTAAPAAETPRGEILAEPVPSSNLQEPMHSALARPGFLKPKDGEGTCYSTSPTAAPRQSLWLLRAPPATSGSDMWQNLTRALHVWKLSVARAAA